MTYEGAQTGGAILIAVTLELRVVITHFIVVVGVVSGVRIIIAMVMYEMLMLR